MGLLGDFDSQLMAFRINYSTAKKTNDPDDAMEYARLLWCSLPKEVRDSNPLPILTLDNSLRSKLDAPSKKWQWCRFAVPMIERAITDNRSKILKMYQG